LIKFVIKYKITTLFTFIKFRIRINCCGIMDMLTFDGGKNILHFQVHNLFEIWNPKFLNKTN